MSRWRGSLLGGGVLLVMLSAGIWLGSARPAAGEGDAMITVDPASQNVALDADPFKVEIAVSNVENLGAYQITLTFDNQVLEYVGAADHHYLESTGRSQGQGSGACVSAGSPANVNQDGVVTFGCTTLGLIEQNRGIAGPSGSGDLLAVGFKPKAIGTSELNIVGLGGNRYTIHPCASRCPPNGDDGVYSFTSLGTVEIAGCGQDNCPGGDIELSAQSGVVQVFDPNAPTPTGVPPTRTVVPPQPTPNVQATVRAVLGTPERRLNDGTPVVGADSGEGTGGGTNGVAGTSSGGRTGTAAGDTNRSASGAPIAGYGPQPKPVNQWPGRASAVLGLAGIAAIAAGVAVSRREASS